MLTGGIGALLTMPVNESSGPEIYHARKLKSYPKYGEEIIGPVWQRDATPTARFLIYLRALTGGGLPQVQTWRVEHTPDIY
jgi:hypothetical protein